MSNRCVLLRRCATGFRGGVGFQCECFGLGPIEFFTPVCKGFFDEVIRRCEFCFGGYGSGIICEFKVSENVFFAVSCGLETRTSPCEASVNKSVPGDSRGEACFFGCAFAADSVVLEYRLMIHVEYSGGEDGHSSLRPR